MKTKLMSAVVLALYLIALVACATPTPLTLTPLPTAPPSFPATPTPVLLPTPISGASWNYAVLGDSSSWGFPRFYAKYIEEDLGVKVKLLDWTVGGSTSRQVLELLRSTDKERFEVSQAEVVTFYGNPLHITSLSITLGTFSDKYDCSPHAVAQYKADLNAIADEIFSLRKGKPTIIRTYTRFMPTYRQWREGGMFQEYQRCVASLDAAVLQLGKERGILVADTGLALNGPNHDQDPNDKGYLIDGMHENDEGAKIVADVFRKLGYSAIIP